MTLCYRDMTFCVNQNCTCDPRRRLTEEVRAAAEKAGLRISHADVCGQPTGQRSCRAAAPATRRGPR